MFVIGDGLSDEHDVLVFKFWSTITSRMGVVSGTSISSWDWGARKLSVLPLKDGVRRS
jgi:hypothetical protein